MIVTQTLGPELRRLLPGLRKHIPDDLSAFYDFVGEQDLLWQNTLVSFIPSRSWPKAAAVLKRLPGGSESEALRAYGLLCGGRFEEAREAARKARGDFPKEASLATLEAAALWLSGDRRRAKELLPEARRAAEAAVALGDRSRAALLLRAQIRFEYDDNKGGIEDLDRLLKRRPGDLAARIGKVEKLTDQHLYKKALSEMARVMRASPGAWWAYAQRGRLHGFCGHPREALRDFSRALRGAPRCGALLSWRGEVHRQLAAYAKARADLERAARLDPRYAFSWECLGRLHLTLGDPRRALACLNRACRADPSHTQAFAWRGEALLKLGRAREAWRDFDAVAPLHPRTTWNAAAREGEKPSREARERQFWADVARAREGSLWGRLLEARLAAAAGRFDQALTLLSPAAGSCRSAAEWSALLGWRGVSLLRLGRAEEAAADLRRAVRLDPKARLFLCWLAEALAGLGRAEEALREYGRALTDGARVLTEGYLGRAALLERLGRREEARADYETAAVLDVKSSQAREGLRRTGGRV